MKGLVDWQGVVVTLLLSFLGLLVELSPLPGGPPWNFEMVLSALWHGPFEPLETVGLKWLSLKTAFLLAIVLAKGVSEPHVL